MNCPIEQVGYTSSQENYVDWVGVRGTGLSSKVDQGHGTTRGKK